MFSKMLSVFVLITLFVFCSSNPINYKKSFETSISDDFKASHNSPVKRAAPRDYHHNHGAHFEFVPHSHEHEHEHEHQHHAGCHHKNFNHNRITNGGGHLHPSPPVWRDQVIDSGFRQPNVGEQNFGFQPPHGNGFNTPNNEQHGFVQSNRGTQPQSNVGFERGQPEYVPPSRGSQTPSWDTTQFQTNRGQNGFVQTNRSQEPNYGFDQSNRGQSSFEQNNREFQRPDWNVRQSNAGSQESNRDAQRPNLNFQPNTSNSQQPNTNYDGGAIMPNGFIGPTPSNPTVTTSTTSALDQNIANIFNTSMNPKSQVEEITPESINDRGLFDTPPKCPEGTTLMGGRCRNAA